MDLHAREPDLAPIKDLRVRQADRSKELCLGNLEKPQELAVINNPGAVDVRPSNVLFDDESLSHLGDRLKTSLIDQPLANSNRSVRLMNETELQYRQLVIKSQLIRR